MGEQPAEAFLDRFVAVRRLAEPVIGARDHVQALRVAGAVEEHARVRGRHHLVAVGLDDEHARDARGRLGPQTAPDLGDQGRARLARIGVGQLTERRGGVPGDHRPRGARRDAARGPEGDVAAEARSEQPDAAVELPAGGEMGQDRVPDGEPALDVGVPRQAGRLPATAKVEAREREAGGGHLASELQVLVAVLGGAHAVTRDHAGAGEIVGEVQDAGHVGGADGHREAVLAHAQTMSKTRQVLTVSSYIASSTGSRLIFATSSATRATSHGPEVTFSNSPWYCQGASLSTSSDSIGTASYIPRSRSR